jgi:uncharacterized damage-inducible protein DinB
LSIVETLVEQLNRTFDGEARHGDPVLTILSDITAEEAAVRPFPAAHSIHEIVRHMTVWKEVVRRSAIDKPWQPTDAEDWAPLTDTSAPAWQASLTHLRERHDALVAAVRGLSDADLERPPIGGQTPRGLQVFGVLQHDVYHAGQIALLKKAAR